MTDRAAVATWVEQYERAWRTAGTEPLATLFTDDATYSMDPYDEPVRGLAAIDALWEQRTQRRRRGLHDALGVRRRRRRRPQSCASRSTTTDKQTRVPRPLGHGVRPGRPLPVVRRVAVPLTARQGCGRDHRRRHHESARCRRPARRARRDARVDLREPDRRRVERAVGLRRVGGARRGRAHGQHPARRRRSVGDARHERRHRDRDGGPVAERRGWTDRRGARRVRDVQRAGRRRRARWRRTRRCRRRCCRWATSARTRCRSSPSTFCFDNYCHLRNDILGPNGPIDRPEPPRDDMRLQPTVEWMLAGLPWMSRRSSPFVDRPVVLALTGPGGGTWTIAPGGDDGRVAVTEGAAGDAGRDHHVRRPRLRHLGDPTPPVVRVRHDRGRRALRVHRPRRSARLLTPGFWRHLTTVTVAVCRQNISCGAVAPGPLRRCRRQSIRSTHEDHRADAAEPRLA